MNVLRFAVGFSAAVVLLLTSAALAHGFAGARFFPATLVTDDPFVADEWSFPTVSWLRDESDVANTIAAMDFAKRITSNIGVEFGASWVQFGPSGGPSVQGFENLSAGAKYEFLLDGPRELIFAFGLNAEIGGSGARRIGADRFSTLTPALFFGKGFGDLPQAINLLRPVAITGSIGVGVPTGSRFAGGAPDALQVEIAFEYSLIYLQTQVRDVGLRRPFDRLIPVVEISFAKPLDYVSQKITGTVSPGLLWAGQYVQLGAEALLPVNEASGRGAGFIAQLHLYIDDLLPQSFGRPLLGA